MRGSVRLAALSGLHVIYVWTHDSVGLGEDGPTHQPVEHYAALRAIPNLWFIRPGDANETAAAWALALAARQRVTVGPDRAVADPPEAADARGHGRERPRRRLAAAATSCARRSGGSPKIILIGTGSELQLAFGAAEALERDGIPARVVSLPCWERFERAGRRPTATPSCRATCRPASPSRPACRSAGIAGSATRARSSGSTTSARRRRPGRSSRSSGSRSTGSTGVARDVLDGTVRGPHPDARSRPPARAARRPSQRSATATPASARDGRHRSRPQLMRVAFAADHAGAALKDEMLRRLDAAGSATRRSISAATARIPLDDYPDFAARIGVRGPRRRGRPRRPDLRLRRRGERRREQDPRHPDAPSATTRTRPTRASSTTT